MFLDSTHTLTRDARLLLATRVIRLFAYGSLAVILMLYLAELGLSNARIGVLLAFTLVGDTAISLWLTTHADQIGRTRMLVIGALLMAAAGVVFATTSNFLLLLLAATIGVISPSGNEVGPFLSIEQAALSHVTAARQRTGIFAWFTLAGSFATAAGSLGGGVLVGVLQSSGVAPIKSYQVVVAGYAAVGIVLGWIFARLSTAIEVRTKGPLLEASAVPRAMLGLSQSRPIVLKLAGLFALDSFAGGFVVQTIAAYWFHVRFGAPLALLGGIFFGANIFAGFSALLASRIASRIGLVKTMVFTHLPADVLLILIPFMPNLTSAVLVLLLRSSISQMDVAPRQSYVMAVVPPEERSAAAGVTNVVRTTGAAISPLFAGMLLANAATFNVPFLVAGVLKIGYDVLLYRNFVGVKPAEESPPVVQGRLPCSDSTNS